MEDNSKHLKKTSHRKKSINKASLRKFVKQNKTTKSIAWYFHVSERTIYYRIKQYDLKGIRTKGRKPFVLKPKPKKRARKWISVKKHFDELNKINHIQNIQYPPFKYINLKTLVCSNQKRNPKGKFTTVGIYYIALTSEVYFIYTISIRYKFEPVPFKDIYEWIEANALDILTTSLLRTGITVEGLIAFTFSVPHSQTEKISIGKTSK